MNWKQFLKLDIRKIIITFILFFIVILVPNVRLVRELFPEAIFLFLVFPIYILSSGCVGDICGIGTNGTGFFIGSILNPVYWYLMSCLIVWIYGEMKKLIK